MPYGLARYGLRELLLATVAATHLCALAAWGLWGRPWAFWPVAGALALLWLWVAAFFRDPPRTPAGEGLLSPADGRVADVVDVGPDSVLGRDGVRIGVFMSVFDVHVNRSPCDATVDRIDRGGEAFLDARHRDASRRNVSTTIHLTCEHDGQRRPLVVRQITGLIARRIVTDLAVGAEIRRGQRIGMIKFGSRLELWCPHELIGEVLVTVGDRVRAGRTVLIAPPKERP